MPLAAFVAISDDPGIEAAGAYNLRDKGTDPSSMEDNFGLVERDFTPKPGYNASVRHWVFPPQRHRTEVQAAP